ncbi:MAG: DMT family transporter [Pseudomonadota bacterium]
MTTRTPTDWALFALLSFLWASAFAMTKVAVEGLPAGLIVFARLALGAVIMFAIMKFQGARFPPLSNRAAWGTMASMGIIGTAAPFYLLTIAQKDIDSALAALLISSTPLYVAGLAHFRFADEKMTWNKALGIFVGFCGVGVLLGPDAMKGLGNSSLIAQLLVLAGGLCYSINTIIARGAPPISAAVLPTGFLGFAALFSLPMALAADYSGVDPTAAEIASVIGLAALPTAGAGWLLMFLIARTSATFISLTGYAIPIFAAVLGAAFLNEQIGWDMALALALILAGVWLAQRKGRAKAVAPRPAG